MLEVDKPIVDLKKYIRDIPDFPEPGILFRDITPLLRNPQAFNYVIDRLVDRYSQHSFDTVVAVESRGFLFGAPLACRMGKSLVLVRKPGKLMPRRALSPGKRLRRVCVGNCFKSPRGDSNP